MRFVPVPGFGMPGPRRSPFLDHDGNLVAWLDRQIFSAKHLYEGTRDPEGPPLHHKPAVGTALIGVLTGLFLRSFHTIRFAQGARLWQPLESAGVVLGPALEPLVPSSTRSCGPRASSSTAAGCSLLILGRLLVPGACARLIDAAPGRCSSSATNAIAAYVLL